jgi:hypothetical protein
VALGKQIGGALATGIGVIKNAWERGQLGELIKSELSVAFAVGTNALIGGVQVAVDLLTSTLGDENLWKALEFGLVGAAMKFGAALLEAMQEPLVKLRTFGSETLDTAGQLLGQGAVAELGIVPEPITAEGHGEVVKRSREGIKAGTAELSAMGSENLQKAADAAAKLAASTTARVEKAIKGYKPGTTADEAGAIKKRDELRRNLMRGGISPREEIEDAGLAAATAAAQRAAKRAASINGPDIPLTMKQKSSLGLDIGFPQGKPTGSDLSFGGLDKFFGSSGTGINILNWPDMTARAG